MKYFLHLKGITEKCERRVGSRCLRAYQQNCFSQRQVWLGEYYAKELLTAEIPDITIAWIDDVMGYGVWTNRDIPAFTYIGEYTGILRKPYFFKDRDNYYCFNYYIRMSFWECNVRAPYLIDAREAGNFTRYINHSDKPNLEMVSVYFRGMLHIIFYAKHFIPKGSQLGYDYGPIYWEKRTKPLPLSNSPH